LDFSRSSIGSGCCRFALTAWKSQSQSEVALRLKQLCDTVILHHEILKSNREAEALKATIRKVNESGKEAERER
jgi:hypothetical protein